MTNKDDLFRRAIEEADKLFEDFIEGDVYRKEDANQLNSFDKTQQELGNVKSQFFLDEDYLEKLLDYTFTGDLQHYFTVRLEEYFNRRYELLTLADYGEEVDEGWATAIRDADFDRFRNSTELKRSISRVMTELDDCILNLYKQSNIGGATRQYVKAREKEDTDTIFTEVLPWQ